MRLLLTLLSTSVFACGPGVGGPEMEEEVPRNDDPESPEPEGPCASVNVAVEAEIPTVMVLVDASGSMQEVFGNTSRGEAVFDTLVHSETGVVAALESDVSFGLTLYTSRFDPYYGYPLGPCPETLAVPASLDNYDAIHQMFAGANAFQKGFETPTGPALGDATQSLAFAPADQPRAIILATDGEPDTCGDPYSDGSPAARNQSLSAVQAAHALGIETYVISVGDEVAEEHLQELANAGVGLPRVGEENARFYQALNPGQLVSHFQSVISGVRTCRFALDSRIDVAYAHSGTVTLDDRELEFETEWDLADSLTLELFGDACDQWKQGDHELSAEFTCTAIIE